MRSNLTVVILTLNEEKNIELCLSSAKAIAEEIVVIDSFSTDGTVSIAEKAGARVLQNNFINYSVQRNFALTHSQIKTEWILFLDADERVSPELSSEIIQLLQNKPQQNGFQMRRQLLWNGKWMRGGSSSIYFLRLARIKKASFGSREVNEHMWVPGPVGKLKSFILHEDKNGIDRWHQKHLRYATLEAREFFVKKNGAAEPSISSISKKRWIHKNIWDRLPLMLRPWLYFSYRYFIRGGFLDGWQGFSYHFLQALWFQLLIGIKIYELKLNQNPLNMTASKPVDRKAS